MKQSKLFSLIKQLPDKDARTMADAIETHKRDSLKKLFSVLSTARRADEPEAADVFKTVFKKKYTK
ncbi:MAG TPA: hypothetical protein VK174_01685, partial [Chitinophagales bacterium]|nr:hypothetical protein [Chitinophagales bacterium]